MMISYISIFAFDNEYLPLAQCAKHRGGFIVITISIGVIINHPKSVINRVISDKIDIPSILFTS